MKGFSKIGLIITLLAISVISIYLISIVFGAVIFTLSTEPNGTIVSRNWTEANITIDGSDLDSFKFNWNTTNYTFYDDSLVLGMNFNNNSHIGECYDGQMQILTDEGWRLFLELSGKEKVLTLNQKTKEPEWQKPGDYAVFNSSGEMYNSTILLWRMEQNYWFHQNIKFMGD